MKKLTLSLAALAAISTMANASNTLADAFSEGSLKGELKAYYFDRENGTGTTDGSILNLGVKLDYETASFYNFNLGLGFQSSNSPWVDVDGKNAFASDMWGEGAVLSQAYLAYTISKTTLKAGRQYIKMPLLKSSGSRLIVQAFEGYTISSKDLPDTLIQAAYIEKFQNRVDGNGNIAGFEELVGDYAYALALTNNSITNTTLTAAYGELESSFDLYYLEAAYKAKMDSLAYNIAAQYSSTDYDNVATQDADYYGVKLGVGISGLSAYIAYAEVNDGTAKYAVAGHGCKPTIFTTAKIDTGDYSESEQYAIDLNYAIKDINTKIGARYVDVDYEGTTKADWTSLYASYKFSGGLKGLSTDVIYEDKDHSLEASDKKELWVKLNYIF